MTKNDLLQEEKMDELRDIFAEVDYTVTFLFEGETYDLSNLDGWGPLVNELVEQEYITPTQAKMLRGAEGKVLNPILRDFYHTLKETLQDLVTEIEE